MNLTIIVKPGTKSGTKFAFPKQGDEVPDAEPGKYDRTILLIEREGYLQIITSFRGWRDRDANFP